MKYSQLNYIIKKLIINLLFLLFISSVSYAAEPIIIATSANFLPTAKIIAKRFENETGNKVLISCASTGILFQQIMQGAPFDLFLAADQKYPTQLIEKGHAIKSSRITYAYGRLMLWSPSLDVSHHALTILTSNQFKHLSIANPNFAPYGVAARQVLEKLALWHKVKSKLVVGGNINQAFNFVASNNADLGIIASSQLHTSQRTGYHWLIPQELYQPIKQQAILLTRSEHKNVANKFLAYLKSHSIKTLISHSGYEVD